MALQLTRPLVCFDLETTGLNVASDRIVEISWYKVFPGGNAEGKTLRVNPECHIPEESTAIHGITDEDVQNCPTFKEIAKEVAAVLDGSDLMGYNSNHFDIPLLAEEFLRAGVGVDLKRKNMVDAYTIFAKMESRSLQAAYRFYCGKELQGAHTAEADTMATYEVLLSQIERYPELPRTVEGLSEFSAGPHKYADFVGRVAYDAEGQEIFNFGKYKGQRVVDVFRRDTGYYGWLQAGDFPEYTKVVFTRLLLGSKKK